MGSVRFDGSEPPGSGLHESIEDASAPVDDLAGTQLMQRNQSVTGYWLTSRLIPGSPTADVVPRLLGLAAEGKLHATAGKTVLVG